MLHNHHINARILTVICATLFNFSSCTNNDSTRQNDKEHPVDESAGKNKKTSKKNILFFGTSLTAGYGLDATEAYPALIQEKIDAGSLPYKVINAGLSGETSAGGKGRIDWLLEQPVNILVLELGANDGLRGLPLKETVKNLQDIINRVKAKYPEAKLVMAGMQIPPNMGAEYATEFREIFPDLATKNKMTLVPFLLQGVGGVSRLNQEDGIHPTAEGQKILADNVWKVLKDLL